MQFVSQICTREGTFLSERVENLEGNVCYQKKKIDLATLTNDTPSDAQRGKPARAICFSLLFGLRSADAPIFSKNLIGPSEENPTQPFPSSLK